MSHSIPVEGTVDTVPADLLLPQDLLLFARGLKASHGEWRDLIAYLLARYGTRILRESGSSRVRFRYQKEGLDLKRVCYLPYTEAIARLRMLSYAARISMCALVVLMLEWEEKREKEEESGIPGVPMKFQCSWALFRGILSVVSRIEASRSHPRQSSG